jgi:hypothetical protein
MANIEKIVISETGAARMLDYKNAKRFRVNCVDTGLIKPSKLPGKKYPVYNIKEVEAILEKTKETDNSNYIKSIIGA